MYQSGEHRLVLARPSIIGLSAVFPGREYNPTLRNVRRHEPICPQSSFAIGTVNTRTFVLLLAQLEPRSFISGQKVSMGPVLTKYNPSEFHHLYPQKFLKNAGRAPRDINRLANFAVISSADNKKLGGKAPSAYKADMNHPNLGSVLASAAVVPRSAVR